MRTRASTPCGRFGGRQLVEQTIQHANDAGGAQAGDLRRRFGQNHGVNLDPAAQGFVQQMRALGQRQPVFSGSAAGRAALGQAADLFEQGVFIADERFNHV